VARAALALRQVLDVAAPAHPQELGILVFDDVCTTGYQLNAVVGRLLDQSRAACVRAPVLARTPWR
jgi:predicted amidophosphoribosyltransferase